MKWGSKCESETEYNLIQSSQGPPLEPKNTRISYSWKEGQGTGGGRKRDLMSMYDMHVRVCAQTCTGECTWEGVEVLSCGPGLC